MNNINIEGLFEDAENDPLWRKAGLWADALPRPTKGYVTVPLSWLARVLPVIRTPEQLAVALLLYRECLMRRSNTVALSNNKLRELGISRQTKYRTLGRLQEARSGDYRDQKRALDTGHFALVPVGFRCPSTRTPVRPP